MAMKTNTKTVFAYLQANADKNLTAADVAAACELETKQVNGIFTSAIQRKEFGYRQEAEIELPDSSHAKVKFLKLTDAGMALDLDATDAE